MSRTRTLWAALVAFVALGAMAAPAHADFNIAVGLKWDPLRYTHPVGVDPNAGQGGAGGFTDLYGWQTTSLDNYIGFFPHEQIGIILSLDLGYASGHSDVNGMNNFDTSFFQFGFALGGKFYLNKPTALRISPYLYVDFFKYFASISTSAMVDSNALAFQAGLVSPVGGDIAFGAEYFFTPSFSLGAEVLGLRIAHVGASWDMGNGNVQNASETYVTFYTAISLNYRFLATASVHTYEEDEDRTNPRPATRRPPARRPPPPPPDDSNNPPPDNTPSPESVD